MADGFSYTTREETLLETYFVMLSKFNFERAKEQCEKEREAKAGLGGTNWSDFMHLLSRLAMTELNYHNLNFVEKSFLKKEPLRTAYNMLLQEFKKVHDIYCQGRGGTDIAWERRLADFISSIMEYILGRESLIEVYQTMDSSEGHQLTECCTTQRLCKEIHEKHSEKFKHSYLKPVHQSFWYEVEVLSNIRQAQHNLSLWRFLPAMLCIQTTHNKLSAWHGMVPPGLPPHDSNRMPSIRSRPPPITSSSTPLLYRWLCTFHNSLLAKFTLYFYPILTKSGFANTVRGLNTKFEFDYIQRFQHLIRTTPTSCVCLVFDSNGLTDFQGPEYRVPGTPAATLTGLNSYPIMVSIPIDFNLFLHKANVVSMIMSQGATSPGAGFSTHHDTKLSTTYHLAQVDARVTLVAILQGTVKEKDSPVIPIITDLIYNLRCHHVLHYLTKK